MAGAMQKQVKKPEAVAAKKQAPGMQAGRPVGNPQPQLAGAQGYDAQRAAVSPAKHGIAAFGQTALGYAQHLGQEIRDDAMNVGGEAIGLAEMLGLRYPVKTYEAQVSPQLYRGSRQDAAGMVALKKQGIHGIVNLCAENDMDTLPAQQAGLVPHHIPIIDNTPPKMSQVLDFLSFVQSSAPVYVHCEAGQGRTGTMVACYRIAAQGWTADAAVAEAQDFGLKMPDQLAFIRLFAHQRGGGSAQSAAPKVAAAPAEKAAKAAAK